MVLKEMEEEIKPVSKFEENKLKHKARRLSIKEGIFWSFRSSLGDHFVAPFAIFTNMSNSIITIINSLWSIGPAAQLIGSKKIKNGTQRKQILKKTMLIDTFGWLFLALIATLYLHNIARPILQYLVIINIATILFSSGYGHPAWFSWIGDIVDSKFRGRWFAKRSTIISFTTIVVAMIAAIILEYSRNTGKENITFIILFVIAFFARLYCVLTISRVYEPELKIKKEKKFTFKHFISSSKKTNFGKFTIFRTLLAFLIGITSPLISIYLLRNLNLDYISYMAIYLSGTLFSIITLNLWGKIADKYGNYKVIALTTIIIPITPILWILSPSPIYLFLIPAILGGTAWSAFIMASENFIYDNTTKDIRAKAISYFNLLTGISSFIGGLVASLLILVIKTKWIEPIFLIFIISSILRIIIAAIWIPKIKERKKRDSLTSLKDLKNAIMEEARPTIIEDFHEISSIGKYIKE